jgi:hypothetical protein
VGRAGPQPIDHAGAIPRWKPFQEILPGLNPFDLKLLAGQYLILLPHFCGQDNLTFTGNCRVHGR